MVYTEHVYKFFAVGASFTKKTQNVFLQQKCPSTYEKQPLSSICANISHLEYSGGQSVTSVRIHVFTCDRKLKEQVAKDYLG